MAKLIIGCGYVGLPLAKCWAKEGETVWATTRSAQRADTFSELGLHPIVLDVTRGTEAELPDVDTVVFAVGFDRTGPHRIEDVYVEGLRQIVEQCSDRVQKFIYLSSTGVYGQTDGDWVDETTACSPIRDGGKACLAAERLLQGSEKLAAKTIILRLAGIYGPDRLPQAAILERGEPLQVAADGHLNLIHVDDIVQVIHQCDASVVPPQVLCVSDGNSVSRAGFYTHLAELLNCAPPQFRPPEPGSSRADRARGSKRVRNDRLMEMVSPDLVHPSYREGLAAIVKQR